MRFELLGSEIIYEGKAFTIRCDHLRLPDGHTTKLDIVEHHGSVVIIPIDKDGNLLFVRQYRHAAALDLLELPAGAMETGELPETCAHREVREETGMAAKKMQLLGGFYLAPGYSTEYMYVFLATDLFENPLKADADEFLRIEKIPVRTAFELADLGKIPDAKSMAAFFMARNQLQQLLKL